MARQLDGIEEVGGPTKARKRRSKEKLAVLTTRDFLRIGFAIVGLIENMIIILKGITKEIANLGINHPNGIK